MAMLAIPGPNTINGKKFSAWETRLQALGLVWDTQEHLVYMPRDKLEKALLRLQEVVDEPHVS